MKANRLSVQVSIVLQDIVKAVTTAFPALAAPTLLLPLKRKEVAHLDTGRTVNTAFRGQVATIRDTSLKRRAPAHQATGSQVNIAQSEDNQMFRWIKRFFLTVSFLALVATNVLTLTHSAFNAALSGLMGTAFGIRTVTDVLQTKVASKDKALKKHVAAKAKRKVAINKFGTRLTSRTKRVAASSIAAIPAESVPILGVSVLIAGTAYELWEACQSLHDLDEMYLDMEIKNENPDGVLQSVCNPSLIFSDDESEVTKLSAENSAYDETGFSEELVQGLLALEKEEYAKSLEILMPLAEDGDVTAQSHIALMYDEGYGVKEDNYEAISWYRRAAMQGDSFAQSMLGFKYFNGDEFEEDYSKATKWFTLSAYQGEPVAQLYLGHIYYEGLGVNKDNEAAFAWYKLAADQGEEEALEAIREIGIQEG